MFLAVFIFLIFCLLLIYIYEVQVKDDKVWRKSYIYEHDDIMTLPITFELICEK